MEERAKGNAIVLHSIGPILHSQGNHSAYADLADLTHSDKTSAHMLDYFLLQVVNCAILRKTFQALYSALQNVADPRADPQTIISRAQNELNLCAASTAMEAGRTMKSLLMDVVANMQNPNPLDTAIPTGFRIIDESTNGGIRRGQLCLFGGLRHTGKTAWARCCAINQGKAGYKVLCFFAESSDADEGVNSMAVLTGYPTKSFSGKKEEALTKMLSGRMIEASKNVLDIRIDTTPSLSVEMIENRCRYLKQTKGLDVIFIDYLQLLQGDIARGQNREQYVSEQARRIKVLARELDCAIILLVQLNDEVAPEDIPEIRHLRESKGPANHADCVMLLQAPHGIGHKSNQSSGERQLRQIWNRKWRGVGASDEPWALDFHGQTQRFHTEYATVKLQDKEIPETNQTKKPYGNRY